MKLLKCHISYLFTKNTTIILLLTTILFGVAFFGNASFNDGLRSEVINEYFLNSQFIVRILLSFIAIFIMANSIYFKNDFYAYFILTNIKRSKYIITKIITNIIVVVLLNSLVFVIFLLIGFIKIKGFYLEESFIKSFVILTLISLIFGFYALILMQIFNNQFIIIIVFGILIISNNLESEDLISEVLLLFFPHDNTYGMIQLLWLSLALMLFNLEYYLKKDLNY